MSEGNQSTHNEQMRIGEGDCLGITLTLLLVFVRILDATAFTDAGLSRLEYKYDSLYT